MKDINELPNDFTTFEFHSNRVSRTSPIYITTCLVAAGAFISLFFIKVQISQQAPALIRPETELSLIHSLVNGRILECRVRENSFVERGQTIFIIEPDLLLEKEKFLKSRMEEIKMLIHDLSELTTRPEDPALFTPFYQQSFRSFREKLSDSEVRLDKVKTDYNRNAKLHQQKVIADMEFEGYELELKKSQNDVEILKQNQLGAWQNDLLTYEREKHDIENQMAQLQREKENMIIKAPVSGHVQNISALYPGTVVMVNQELCQISPDADLIAEVYVNPNDIGLLHVSTPVRFQVNAFNYNQWGLAKGSIREISDDIQVINNQPVFKVRCVLHSKYLQLSNGYRGYLKKGMTLQARFQITERTLWQLLYDKADDWLNPYTFIR